MAESEADLPRQLQQVPLAEYQAHRRRLEAAEAPRQFMRRLHHDLVSTGQHLIDRHAARRAELICGASTSGKVDSIHTS